MDDAYEVDFDREANPHFAFGGGIHRCLGSHLARLELRVALREWHRRIPEYAVEPGHESSTRRGSARSAASRWCSLRRPDTRRLGSGSDGHGASATAFTRSSVRSMSRSLRRWRRNPPSGYQSAGRILPDSRNDSVGVCPASGARCELVPPGVHRLVAHHDAELEDLAGAALGDLARGPVRGPALVALHVAPVARADGRTGRVVEPLGLEDLGAVLGHPRDVADPAPTSGRLGVDVKSD